MHVGGGRGGGVPRGGGGRTSCGVKKSELRDTGVAVPVSPPFPMPGAPRPLSPPGRAVEEER